MEIIYVDLPLEIKEVFYRGKIFRNKKLAEVKEDENLHVFEEVKG